MALSKKLKSVAHNMAHHSVSGLSYINPHLAKACKIKNLVNIKLNLLDDDICPNLFSSNKEIKDSCSALKETFIFILNDNNFSLENISSAFLSFYFNFTQWDAYSSLCKCEITHENGKTYSRIISFLGKQCTEVPRNSLPLVTNKPIVEINGENFYNLSGFYNEITNSLSLNDSWGKNLDAFNELLRGGFGTPENGFILLWSNSEVSKQKLSQLETRNYFLNKLPSCEADKKDSELQNIHIFKNEDRTTIFDWLINIITDHCINGNEAEDGIILLLG